MALLLVVVLIPVFTSVFACRWCDVLVVICLVGCYSGFCPCVYCMLGTPWKQDGSPQGFYANKINFDGCTLSGFICEWHHFTVRIRRAGNIKKYWTSLKSSARWVIGQRVNLKWYHFWEIHFFILIPASASHSLTRCLFAAALGLDKHPVSGAAAVREMENDSVRLGICSHPDTFLLFTGKYDHCKISPPPTIYR